MTPTPSGPAGRTGRRRGPSKGDLKEAALLDTAYTLLTEKALAAISVEDLTRGAGISRSQFYFYFDSKDAVMLALAERITDEIRTTVAGFHTKSDGSVPDLRKAIAGYLNRWRTQGPVLRAMSLHAESDPALNGFWTGITDDLLAGIVASVERGQRAGHFAPPPPRPEDLAHVLFAMLWRTGYEFSTTPMTRADEKRLIGTLAVVFERTLGIRRPA
ncbi:TetR family transcriptional regulator [Streptomyces sp. NPDC008150]|uniref:TetR/AcrR family transcriptional regulator n=1 Tax=Streptomyces sp. NPDC008150 TaxID=3364816 RepID=UPI0036E761C3